MTKEQWLENMKSDSPDYDGLLELRDKDLLKYLIDGLCIANKDTPNTCPPAFEKFIDNVMGSEKLAWITEEK
jgi:hypothetical protein